MKKKTTINVVTLGCSKNVVDSEYLMKQLDKSFEIYYDENKFAEIVIINTCGFITDAKAESIEMIMQFARAKKAGLVKYLFVMGCLVERYKSELKKEIPEVDDFFGVDNISNIVKKLGVDFKHELIGERLLTTPSHYAYLKISEGCDRNCSFCAIPLIRGKHVSIPEEQLLTEAGILASKGVKELILIAQDLSYYGLDIYKKQTLAHLIEKLSEIKGIEWIRLHYAYPHLFPMDVLDVMKNNPKVCKYIDIPFQHISDNLLKIMRRGSTKKDIIDLISTFKKKIPGIAIRTSLLVGHPGETEDDFIELKEFVNQVKFDRLGVFLYSHEEDTHSYKNYKDDILDEVKGKRAEDIMFLQQEISLQKNLEKIGKSFKVIIDRTEGDFYVGRTEYDSPEVDGEVLISNAYKEVKQGEFHYVTITSADEYDLYGEIVI